ncbi:hypothetical protein QYR02_17510 [Microbacterium maritypicum]|uniref:hypothetical protein n=1 Tax=Microbacterium maritypicum TaxID=33918 RepID=UPI002672564A|nr:hypothetical protein [Microbacterium liquefaciens]WKT89214.1 hypothetical protein QYR02_17510 [Microbacterium liquefaciens]
MLKKLAVISLAAGALVLVAPTVATAAPTVPAASSDSYPTPPGAKVGDPIIDICEVSTIVFGPGYFLESENVNVSVSGYNAGKAAVSGNIAGADGSLTLTFRPPSDGEGSYAVAFNGSRSYTATITVSHGHDAATSCDHDPGVASAGSELPLTSGGIELALTGGSVSPWVLGGGAAALVAGGALVAVGASRRKRA